MLKNKYNLVTFYESILVSLWTFRPNFVHRKRQWKLFFNFIFHEPSNFMPTTSLFWVNVELYPDLILQFWSTRERGIISTFLLWPGVIVSMRFPSIGKKRSLSKLVFYKITKDSRRCRRGVMVKAMACGIVVREFALQSRYYVHFRADTLGKDMKPLILPAMG